MLVLVACAWHDDGERCLFALTGGHVVFAITVNLGCLLQVLRSFLRKWILVPWIQGII